MHKIKIDTVLKQKWEGAALGCIECNVKVSESSQQLLDEIQKVSEKLCNTLAIEQIKLVPAIEKTRACCRALGKDVKRYRNSSEAMHRRVLQGKGIYQINNVIEVNSLITLKTGYSMGTYDLDHVCGEIVWTAAEEGVHYEGIGKDSVNVGHLPALRDEEGFFGNPNSDSARTRITEQSNHILLCLYGFNGAKELEPIVAETAQALQTYCSACEIETKILF